MSSDIFDTPYIQSGVVGFQPLTKNKPPGNSAFSCPFWDSGVKMVVKTCTKFKHEKLKNRVYYVHLEFYWQFFFCIIPIMGNFIIPITKGSLIRIIPMTQTTNNQLFFHCSHPRFPYFNGVRALQTIMFGIYIPKNPGMT